MIYPLAIFLGSGLLFLIEPIAAKRLLPLLGGGAAVWTACLVFFQCALLLGYLLAHWIATHVAPRRQATIYVALLVGSLVQLGFALDPVLVASSAHPVASVLWLLTRLIGLPFVTLSATSPLLQAWFASETGGSSAYRLYAVSNAGSLLALVVYPWWIEPAMSLHAQSLALAVCFVLFGVACVVIAIGRRGMSSTVMASAEVTATTRVRARQVMMWIVLATCGSLLLAAVTTYISQNVATIPLMWIVPLVAYLLSFVGAFSDDRFIPQIAGVGLGAAGLAGSYYLLSKGILGTPLVVVVSGFCLALLAICLFLHAELYRRRPVAARLTTFYICIAVGGAFGAVLVGVVAPVTLDGNYELAFGLTLAAALGVVATWEWGALARIIAIGATLGMSSLIVTEVKSAHTNTLTRARNFYGTLHVTQIRDNYFGAQARTLYNGAISHGRQIFREDIAHAPTSYYGRKSGVGYAIDFCCEGRPKRIGVIGLGTGTIAAYGAPGDVIRFYDINPAVEPIARDRFTYLRGSAATIDIVIGDARVSLAEEAPQRYDVIAVDAFSGDAIPVHLITLEALEVYKRHLAPGGIVAFHVSNRHLDLKPVVAQLAARAGMRTAYIMNAEDQGRNVWSSDWVLVTANSAFLARREVIAASDTITVPGKLRLWTDDYNSLLPIFKLRR